VFKGVYAIITKIRGRDKPHPIPLPKNSLLRLLKKNKVKLLTKIMLPVRVVSGRGFILAIRKPLALVSGSRKNSCRRSLLSGKEALAWRLWA